MLKRLKTNWTYHNIPFRLFIEIVNTGKTELLGGLDYNEAWLQIIKDNAEATDNSQFNFYTKTFLKKSALAAKYLVEKASLLMIAIKVDEVIINDLRLRGYKINTNNDKKYLESINAGLRRVSNLSTKIGLANSQMEEIIAMAKSVKRKSADELLAEVSAGLGFAVDDNVTLARFNEYSKIVANKNKPTNGRN